MNLIGIYAYKVFPRMLVKKDYVPSGGEIPISSELEAALEDSIKNAKFDFQNEVAFTFPNDKSRLNNSRELIRQCCFGNKDEVKGAVVNLAVKLSNSMNRTKQTCLLIVAIKSDGGKYQITLWSFPPDTSFRFMDSEEKVNLEVYKDVFSKGSNFRKAAFFEGENLRSDFLSGRILDFQGGEVAKFWYESFLECGFAMGKGIGARKLAKALRETYDKLETPEDKQVVTNALLGLRNKDNSEISFSNFAETFLLGKAGFVFNKVVDRENLSGSRFILDIEEFNKTAKFQVNTLDTGAIVYAPFDNFNEAVKITEEGNGRKLLSCEGYIEKTKIK